MALLQALAAGRPVVLPTDTVPGLGLPVDRPRAAAELARLKGAQPDRPWTLHLRSKEELRRLLPTPPPGLAAWLDRRLPGPLTVVLPRRWMALPADWSWPWTSVGLRLPDHPLWRELAPAFPAPLLMSSVNDAGRPPLRGPGLAAWLAARPEVVVGLDPVRAAVGHPSPVVAFAPLPRCLRGELEAAAMRPGLRVLVVCTGNICRSPLAAALLGRELAAAWGVSPEQLPELGWVVASAGTMAQPGGPASAHSATVAREQGLSLARHRSRSLLEALAEPWDLVLAMGRSHLTALPPGLRSELLDPLGEEIVDPYGGDLAAYRRMHEHLRRAIRDRVDEWCAWPGEAAA